jgi:hypothetical protein
MVNAEALVEKHGIRDPAAQASGSCVGDNVGRKAFAQLLTHESALHDVGHAIKQLPGKSAFRGPLTLLAAGDRRVRTLTQPAHTHLNNSLAVLACQTPQ